MMESREMPESLAAWKIFPSTSMLTALVHSSNRAYLGLTYTGGIVLKVTIDTVVFLMHTLPIRSFKMTTNNTTSLYFKKKKKSDTNLEKKLFDLNLILPFKRKFWLLEIMDIVKQ